MSYILVLSLLVLLTCLVALWYEWRRSTYLEKVVENQKEELQSKANTIRLQGIECANLKRRLKREERI